MAGLSTRAVARTSVPEYQGADDDLEFSPPVGHSGRSGEPAEDGWPPGGPGDPPGGPGGPPGGLSVRSSGKASGKGLAVLRTATLVGSVRRASDHTVDQVGSQRLLPVLPELRELLPGRGLRRGATIAVATVRPPTGPAGRSGPPARPRCCWRCSPRPPAPVRGVPWSGCPTLGAVAAAEAGVALDRLALVPNPGPDWADRGGRAARRGGHRRRRATRPAGTGPVASRLAARARQRGTVFVPYGTVGRRRPDPRRRPRRLARPRRGRGRLRGRQLTSSRTAAGAARALRRTQAAVTRGRSCDARPPLVADRPDRELDESLAQAGMSASCGPCCRVVSRTGR